MRRFPELHWFWLPMTPEANSLYKIFLVEDEIVAREGIRDTVAWAACGFEFVGEAADGEAALPLIQQRAPDLLITDIRMPFMDGLQLSRLVRERLPQTRIVILSGYDEFTYAQAAIALGVSEYILKPVSAHDIEQALIATKLVLDRERALAAQQRQLVSQVEDTRALQRRELLKRLCLGDLDPFEALERSHEIGLELAAACYAVVVARGVLPTPPFDARDPAQGPRRLQQLQSTIYAACAELTGAEAFRKDIEEVVVLLLGDDMAYVRAQITALLQRLVDPSLLAAYAPHTHAARTQDVRVLAGVGSLQTRMSDLPLSFATALDALHYEAAQLEATQRGASAAAAEGALGDAPVHLERQQLDRYLRFGIKRDFDTFFAEYTAAVDDAAFDQRIVRDYLLMDMSMAAAACVSELGGNPAAVIPEVAHPSELATQVHTLGTLQDLTRTIFDKVLDFRDAVARQQHRHRLIRARAYIEQHAGDVDLSLTTVAAHVNVSPSHFSAIFSRETGETFKEFLTRIRMERAQGLLRSTSLPIVEIAQRSGYSDPHYFSAAFKRVTGMPPRDYREARPSAGEDALV